MFRFNHGKPYTGPETKDREILAERVEAYNDIAGPRRGDYVKTPDGKYHRFAWVHDDNIQCVWGGGSFYLGKGYIEYSGGLNAGVKRADLIPTGETKAGEIWFFHHNDARAYNGVVTEIKFRVYALKAGADLSGLWEWRGEIGRAHV